jgi:hypothetical protein
MRIDDPWAGEGSRDDMSTADHQELKQVVKEAIREVMSEDTELLKDLMVEALEDFALLQRMEEGRQSDFVSREEIMEILEPKP